MNGAFFLRTDETVIEDNDADVLTGSSGRDWFFADEKDDRLTDWHSDETYANDFAFI